MKANHIEAMKLALEGAANYIDTLGGDSRKYRQALAEQPAQQVVDCHATGVCVQSGLRAEQPRAFGTLAQQEPLQNNPFDCGVYLGSGKDYAIKHHVSYGPAQQEPVAWKLVPREPTHEMLKAMDECSTEGYDERLYAGHASSVYMAAVDVAPTPPQRKPLSDEEIILIVAECASSHQHTDIHLARAIEAAHGIKGGA